MPRKNIKSFVRTTVDFERPGKQVGVFQIPLSVHDDAWGVVPIPVAVINNGPGPTVILEGGNHGDEYEGPITLGEMIRELDPASVSGRLIFVPTINQPAVAVGRRTSPIDEMNMNRAFPGDPYGTTTQQITAVVNDILFPIGDVFIDLHSGGSSLDIMPSAVIEPGMNPERHAANVAAARAFGAPIAVAIDNRGDPRTATASAAAAGLTVVGTEMAGGGTVSIDALAFCRRGVRNVLAHVGAIPIEMAELPEEEPKLYELTSEAHLISEEDGVFESRHSLGTRVKKGELAGRVHFITRPDRAPVDMFYCASGILYGRRQPGRVRPGNCCLVVASPYEPSK
jgi:N-alpha-acetyl-L-2,4-diaminobutyrate deacetylase